MKLFSLFDLKSKGSSNDSILFIGYLDLLDLIFKEFQKNGSSEFLISLTSDIRNVLAVYSQSFKK